MALSATAIELALQYGLKYGPEIGAAVTKLLAKADPTEADVLALFDGVRTYESFNIPDVAPTAPVAVTEPVAVSTPPTESSSVAPSPS